MTFSNRQYYAQAVTDSEHSVQHLGMIAFATHWADLMEGEVGAGNKLEDIAEGCLKTALSVNAVTGYMQYGAAMLLVNCWVYGEDLRAWWKVHNNSRQPVAA